MTPVGHMLVGATLATACLPPARSWRRAAGHYAAFILLANAPDFALPGWGHDRYDISHSVFTNSLLIAAGLIALRLKPEAVRWVGGWAVLASAAGAWLSHLLLDSLYNHGRGVAIFWPFSGARLALPIPWFSVAPPPPPFTAGLWKEFALEFVSFGLVLATALAWRLRSSAWDWAAGTDQTTRPRPTEND
jgi:hypothetical protein